MKRTQNFHKKHRIRNRKEWLNNLHRTVKESISEMEKQRLSAKAVQGGTGPVLDNQEAQLNNLAHKLAKHFRRKYYVPAGISLRQTESVVRNAILEALNPEEVGLDGW